MSASLVQGEGAFSAGKERSSEANRGDCSAKAEGRAAHAREVAASADAARPQQNEPEAQHIIRLSDKPVKGGVHGRDGQGGAATDPGTARGSRG